MNYTNRNFGIEIEFVGVARTLVERELRAAGIDARVESYNHRTTENWKIVTDASLHDSSGLTGELVSPILQGADGFRQLKTVCNVLNSIQGCTVNRTCGLHVHLDCRDMTAPEIATVFERYGEYEQQIDQIMPISRRGGTQRWCRSISNHKSLLKAHGDKRSQASALGRYYKVNMTNVATRGAMEFRQHSGTTEYPKISNWVKFLMAFVERSIVLSRTAPTAHEVPVIRPRKSRAFDHARRIANHFGIEVSWAGRRYIFSANGRTVNFHPDQIEAAYDSQTHDSLNLNYWMNLLGQFGLMPAPSQQQVGEDQWLAGVPAEICTYLAQRITQLA